jgi:cupin fold WbuC family metalloprotein
MESSRKSLIRASNGILSHTDIGLLTTCEYSATGTRRLCLHETDSSNLHVMVVQTAPGVVFERHLHQDSDELITVLKGELELSVWRDGLGVLPTILVLGGDFSGKIGVVIPAGTPHVTRCLTSDTTYLEVKRGPFSPNSMLKI